MKKAGVRDRATDERFMRRAIALAERGLCGTNPNPPVGCVLVRAGVVVGEGFHRRAGTPHAEAHALAQAGDKARGATAYVTLEPCAPHKGKRTPACAPRLIQVGVSRVVVGVRDSNPSVRGAGLRLLTDAGLEVSEGACLAETRRLTQHFNTAMRRLWPFVTLKVAATLDGRIATAAGESKWITSKKQRTVARSLRGLFDGVLVGVQTAIDDDPMLLPAPRPSRPSARIILDSTLRLPLDSRLVQSARRDPLIVICVRAPEDQRRALEDRGAIVLSVPGRSGRVSLPSALRALFRRGLTSVLVEGGSEVMGSFVRTGLFDEFVLFRAPLLLGGRGSRSVVGGDNPARLREAVRMKRASPEASATLRYGLSTLGEIDVEVYEPRDRKG